MFVRICFVFCALSGLKLVCGAPQKDADSAIVFPGPVQDVSSRYGNDSNVPDKCKNLNFCNIKPKDYPQETFNKMFKGKIKEPIFQPTFVMTDDRQGDYEDMDDCESTISFERLYQVKAGDGKWHTVVQAPDENYLQMVRIETCVSPGSSCFKEFENGHEIICHQQYNKWEFMVKDDTSESKTKRLIVDLPVCCSCRYKAAV
ncbi:uncharacterized protein LOC113500487 isoform X3 [Trichoplusia ni]|uniref:Uncharacterized protein LOC113500487 isoform X3 n=1 Tax=Trichoplusia ni TaxID=7111 RepID=A0A7E5W8Y3_TRINI|nr:uncharacterized protein LOC113500487 isoform X3 [Trichoplusia ni]